MTHVKYLGIIIDQHLSFKKQVRRVINNVKFNINNFKNIRHQLSQSAALLFVHTLILPHLSYCITTWSQAGATTLKPVYSRYKQFLKVLDKKPRDYHYCTILKKFNLLNLDSFVFYSDVCLMYKIIHNLAPPPLRGCLAHNGSAGRTRASARGDLVPQYRKTVFGQTAFSVRVVRLWNSLPTNIRSIDRYAVFKINLKHWLLLEQICNH